MTEEKKLFKLIKSLSEEQCKVVELALDGMLSKNLPVLFRRMNELEQWDEDSRNYIKNGGRFTNRGKYHTYCKELRRTIVSIFCQPSDFGFDLVYIQKAIELDVLELAVEKAWESIQEAQREEDRARLLIILAKVQDLELAHRIRFEFPGEVPDIHELKGDFDQEVVLGSLMVKVKKAFKENYESRLLTAGTISEQMSGVVPIGRKSRFRKQKVAIGCKILTRDFHAALALQEQLVDWMLAERNVYQFTELVYEIDSLTRMSVSCRRRDLISKSHLFFSSLEPQTPGQVKQKAKTGLETCAFIGEYLPSKTILMSSEKYLEHVEGVNPSILANVYFSQALAYFYFGEIDNALSKLLEFSFISTKHSSHLQWEFLLLQAICLKEKGEIEPVFYNLEQAKYHAGKSDSQYPKMAVSMFSKYFISGNSDDLPLYIEKLTEILQGKKEQLSSRNFDLRHFFRSKYEDIPLYQIIEGLNRPPSTISRLVVGA